MAFLGLLCAAIRHWGLVSWCHCATALGNPELSVPRESQHTNSAVATLVGPGFAAPERKIVGIGGLPARRHLWLDDLVGNALALAIGHGLFLGVETNRELLLPVAR